MEMDDKNSLMRSLPQVERLLSDDRIRGAIQEIGRPAVADIIRDEIAAAREAAERGATVDPEGIAAAAAARCARAGLDRLRRVVNATGVFIHTNLGRAPLGRGVLERLAGELNGYCNLELDLAGHRRGQRGGIAESLLCRCTGAEDALIVNNNAASVFLALVEFARGREVIVSRGELVQIGGGFRLPEIMAASGARLVEVGTTNITTIDDYRRAVTDRTAMIFSCHRSNFSIEGFTDAPPLSDLAALRSETVLFVRDMGSGNPGGNGRLPRPFDATVRQELDQGPDLICFSCDKLLGASQAGVIAGKRDLVARLRRNPLMRMIRVDKLTAFILQDTLLRHVNGEPDGIALWGMIGEDTGAIAVRVNRFIRLVRKAAPSAAGAITRVETKSVIGGGSLPGYERESRGVTVELPGLSAEALYDAFIAAPVPVVGAIAGGRFTLDFSTVRDDDVPAAAEAAVRVIAHTGGGG